MFEKCERCLLQVCQGPEPFSFVLLEEADPPVKHGVGDPKACAELFNSPQMEEIFADNTQDRKEGVGTIGDQRIGQEGMGTPAAPTPDPGDLDSLTDRAAVEEIKDITLITGEAGAAAPAPAVGAGFLLRPELLLLALIEAGCRTFYTN